MRRALCVPLLLFSVEIPALGQVTAVRAGRLLDPDSGSVRQDQVLLVEGGKITALGAEVAIPKGARVIDLGDAVVLPGLFDAHTHMALTTVAARDFDRYYFTTLLEPTAYRAVQGVTNLRSMLESGFTTLRDVGNAGNYADTALRRAIEDGWIPGPTLINAGRIIAPHGGQFQLQPEKQALGEPEYFFADTPDELRKAVRQNIHYGAKVIKLVVDAQPYIYTEEEIRAAVEEAGRAGLKVAAHAYSNPAARNAVLAGVASIEHGDDLNDENLALMKERGVYLVSTDFPVGSYYSVTPESYARSIDRLKRAYRIGTPLAFGTDVVYYKEGRTRGDLTLDFLQSFADAGVPPADILRAMTINAARLLGVDSERGRLQVGMAADLIALPESPLQNIQALRKVSFVMKAGKVYKEGGRFVWTTPTRIGK